jgi:predicted NUDIX family NTP pyrophosphohydrolase
MPSQSAGILLYRRRARGLEVLLVHPGGPYWAKKDAGAWTLPKGEIQPGEEILEAARRELAEETGLRPGGPFASLGSIRQSGGKTVHGFAAEADVDPATIVSGTFTLEWPPRSGRSGTFPEVDRADWFSIDEARGKLNAAQVAFLDRLAALVGGGES